MKSFPIEVQLNIFSRVDDYSKHLISKHFRNISMLSMSYEECVKRANTNIFNIDFLILLSQNPNCHQRRKKYDAKENLWIMEVSCFEYIFEYILKNSFSISLSFIFAECFIPLEIYNKLLQLACLYNSRYAVLKLLESNNVTDCNDSFFTAFDHKYFDIVEILFDWKNKEGNYLHNFDFDEEQSRVFKEVFIEDKYENQDLSIFKTINHKNALAYYSYSRGNKKLMKITRKLINERSIILVERMNYFLNLTTNYYYDLLWKTKNLKSYKSHYPQNDDLNEFEYYSMIAYRSFINDEIGLFNFILYLRYISIYNFIKLISAVDVDAYKLLTQDKRFILSS